MTRLVVVAILLLLMAAAVMAWKRWERTRSAPERLTDIGATEGWVVFTGPFCATCTQIVDRLEGAGETVTAIDVEARPDLAAAHAVTTVPTIVRLEQGAVVAGAAGRRPAAALVAEHLRR